MLAHTKMHPTEKSTIKNKIKEDISAFKKHLFEKIEADDLAFIKEMQGNSPSNGKGQRINVYF